MKLEEMVKKYKVTLFNPSAAYRTQHNLPSGDMLNVGNVSLLKSDNMVSYIREHKQEIIDFLKEPKDKVPAIPGLKEIETLEKEWKNFRRSFNASFDHENAAGIQARIKRPDTKPAALRKKYPQADAYLRMKDLVNSSDSDLSAIGDRAMEMVIDGNWQEALKYADREQQKFTEEHLWD